MEHIHSFRCSLFTILTIITIHSQSLLLNFSLIIYHYHPRLLFTHLFISLFFPLITHSLTHSFNSKTRFSTTLYTWLTTNLFLGHGGGHTKIKVWRGPSHGGHGKHGYGHASFGYWFHHPAGTYSHGKGDYHKGWWSFFALNSHCSKVVQRQKNCFKWFDDQNQSRHKQEVTAHDSFLIN